MVHLLHADARRIPLADNTVQCVVTSPPYWGLRRYAGEQSLIWGGAEGCEHVWQDESESNRDIRTGLGLAEWSKANARGGGLKPAKVGSFRVERATCSLCGAWRGAYGLEPTIAMYVEHTIEILRGIRRVLRKDGVCFWNVGDSYVNSGRSARTPGCPSVGGWASGANCIPRNLGAGLRPKNLCLIPQRVAIAAQDDGWFVRSVIVWNKTNPMPESAVDRPADAYEPILMLTKSARYFWDAEAVAEPCSPSTHARVSQNLAAQVGSWRANGGGKTNGPMRAVIAGSTRKLGEHGSGVRSNRSYQSAIVLVPENRNMRNVWTFATQPYKGAHFATFPEELPRRAIMAATSAKGACPKCGAPWCRIVKRSGGTIGSGWIDHKDDRKNGRRGTVSGFQELSHGRNGHEPYRRTAIGWRPTCDCGGYRVRPRACFSKRLERAWYRKRWQSILAKKFGQPVPSVVLDPFGGSGTTGRVAASLRRQCVLLDLAYGGAEGYRELAEGRTSGVQMEAFA